MKRFLTTFLALAMLGAMTACSRVTDRSEADTPTQTETETIPETTSAEETGSGSETGTPGQQLLAEFRSRMADGTDYTTQQLAAALVEMSLIPFSGTTMDVEPGYLNGFTQDVTGFSEGTFFGPMISSIPFAGYIFRLDEGEDTAAFMAQLEESSDLAWNVCTTADEKVIGAEGSTVFFVMCPASFEEE